MRGADDAIRSYEKARCNCYDARVNYARQQKWPEVLSAPRAAATQRGLDARHGLYHSRSILRFKDVRRVAVSVLFLCAKGGRSPP